MQNRPNVLHAMPSIPRLFGVATLAALALVSTVADAADRTSASSRTGGSTQSFRASPDFHDIAERSVARFADQNSQAQAVATACIAGCYNGAGAGVVEIKVEAYEVLTSTGNNRTASVAAAPVHIALNDSVRCVAGCSAPGAARAPARLDIIPPVSESRALAMLKPHRPQRNVTRFAMSSNVKSSKPQRSASLVLATTRTLIR